MLDIKKLEKQFDEILNSFTKEDLEQWLAFADRRDMICSLVNSEEATRINFETYSIVNVKPTVHFTTSTMDDNYAYVMAA